MARIVDSMFDSTFTGLARSLDLYKKRNEALASNIANADTPGYRAVELTFAGELERAFGAKKEEIIKTNSEHLDLTTNSSAHYLSDLTGATKADGNNVDLDMQMGKLVRNADEYSRAANLVYKKLNFLRNAIQRSQS